jgi:hypothetical protein
MKQKILCWSPRILAILAILFMMMFSADCFEEGNTLSNKLICLFMHNIPAFICIGALIVAWKWERIGGILFILIFLAAAVYFKSFTGNPASLIVISPFLLTGILFILSFRHNRSIRQSSPEGN